MIIRRPSWIGFDSYSVIYLELLLYIFTSGICAGIFCVELLIIYSQIIEKTHKWVIISAVMHVDIEFWKSDGINLGYFNQKSELELNFI